MKHDIRALTGIRGVAELLIVIYHYFARSHLGAATNFVRHCYVVTDLFFMLSGMVLALTYGRRFAPGWRLADYASFLFKRLARVYPLLFVVSLLMVAITLRHPSEGPALTPVVFVTNALLINAWGVVRSFVGPGWSVSTEFGAYLLFPLFAALTLRGRPAVAVASAIASLGALTLVATRSAAELHQPGVDWHFGPLDVFDATTLYPLLRCLADFNLGLLAFRLARLDRIRTIAASPLVGDGVVLLVVLLLLAPRTPVVDVPLVACFAPLLMTLGAGRSHAARLLARPLVHDFGLLSYSVYLLHDPANILMGDKIGWLLHRIGLAHTHTASHLVLIPIVVGLSILTYRWIERPARDRSRHLLTLSTFLRRARGTGASRSTVQRTPGHTDAITLSGLRDLP